MRPYTVQYLSDPSTKAPPDPFELVGILVHAGTAESGHYYSYIREAPSNGGVDSWVEYNDDTVSHFDPTTIGASCFGGVDTMWAPKDAGSYQFDKNYSAYMLFYKRSSVVSAQQQAHVSAKVREPVRVPVPSELGDAISDANELFMRKYCMYDTAHATFVVKMLASTHNLNDGPCTASGSLQQQALWAVLNHLDQVFSRAKDYPDWILVVRALEVELRSCIGCCENFLKWVVGHREALRALLVKSYEPQVRIWFMTTLMFALKKLKETGSRAYLGWNGSESDDSDDGLGHDSLAHGGILLQLLDVMYKLWDHTMFITRSWNEYFCLLGHLAALGPYEHAKVMECHFLDRVLNVITVDMALNPTAPWARLAHLLSKRKATNFEGAIYLLRVLLDGADLKNELAVSPNDRFDPDFDTTPVTRSELNLIRSTWRNDTHILTEKLLWLDQNAQDTQHIIRIMLSPNARRRLGDRQKAIALGIQQGIKAKHIPISPYLKAALTFTKHASKENALRMYMFVSLSTEVMDVGDAREYMSFFTDFFRISADHLPESELFQAALQHVGVWAPALLLTNNASVRADVEAFIKQDILQHDQSNETANAHHDELVIEAIRAIANGCLVSLKDKYIKAEQTVVPSSLTQILAVIDICKSYFNVDGAEPDDDDVTFRENLQCKG